VSDEYINPNTGRPQGVAGGTAQIMTAAEAAREAGATGRPVASALSELTALVDRILREAPLSEHHRMMAKTKADELMFWIRAGMARRDE
jgi:hypothetical protein